MLLLRHAARGSDATPLRLVNTEAMAARTTMSAAVPLVATPAWSLFGRGRTNAAAARQREVARANQDAAGLSAVDARWVLALQVHDALEGGRAAILTPERRRELVAAAVRLGLRPFDANLVIAIVQDGARSGEGAIGVRVGERLRLVPAPRRDDQDFWWRLGLGALAGVGLLLWLVGWVMQGA